VAEYGMGTQIGSRRLPLDDYSVSDATRRILDEEQQELTDLAMRRARKLLEENRETLESLAAALLDGEVLERPDIDTIMARHSGPVAAPRIAATDPGVSES
jgi:cell division protease FtsH